MQKSADHTYDSNNGHAYYIGCQGGKVVWLLVYSKTYNNCNVVISMEEEPMDYDNCPRNYEIRSSKAMEASAVLDLILRLHTLGVGVELIVSDDNNTM